MSYTLLLLSVYLSYFVCAMSLNGNKKRRTPTQLPFLIVICSCQETERETQGGRARRDATFVKYRNCSARGGQIRMNHKVSQN